MLRNDIKRPNKIIKSSKNVLSATKSSTIRYNSMVSSLTISPSSKPSNRIKIKDDVNKSSGIKK